MLSILAVAQAETGNAVDNQQAEDPQTGRFTWTIENFSRLNTKKLYSETFIVGGYKWYNLSPHLNGLYYVYLSGINLSLHVIFVRRILVFPKGNNVEHLSMYLDVADSANLPYGWSRYAQFSLAIINQVQNKYSVRKGTLLASALHLFLPNRQIYRYIN